MRLTVTVADPDPAPDVDTEGRSADFLIDTDPRVPAGDLAAELFRQLHGRPAATAPVLHLGAEPVPADRLAS
ncbi:hypothetical protein GTW66_21970 [Streptomyces sp. SID5473]|uniref:hypothetical protein n=1 Tax=Streptomyces sp. SID5473 TaxID=2690299 RepID=UPI00025CE59C|nr:hypothetical protein [Streptomyces sp. SID5473]EIF93030.1 hypothetical protein [Streptomyces tsukubensis NRRL18488]MYS66589.1 hypothetical protein [Streptomyces sp. SID5473]